MPTQEPRMSSSEHPREADRAGHPPSADDPLGFPLAFVSVFTMTFFGWFFLTTRGYRRLLGVPAGLLALVVLFMWAYDHKVALPTLIGVLALFGLVARYA